ncbi:MAG: S8 family serine peptidase [Thermoleophilaceae bacterium]|nr:S8 family serine peptidase [Thermoleophilaceae bacterium]
MHDNTFVHGVSTVSRSSGTIRLLGVVVLLAAGLTAMLAVASAAGAAVDTTAAPTQLIVGFANGTSRSESSSIINDTDASIVRRLPGGSALIDVEPGADIAGVADQLEAEDDVRYASPNFTVRASAVAADPLIADGSAWGLMRVHALNAWPSADGSGAVVAVLDSGVNTANPDLAANLWTNSGEIAGNGVDDDNNGFIDDVNGADWVERDGTPNDAGGHGSHVAGTIAASAGNNFAASGVAPGARIMPLRFLDGNGAGTVADAIAGIDYAISNRADVINASWGGPDFSPPLRDAIARAGAAGLTFVAAAGNDGLSNDSSPTYPAAFSLPNLIAVAASDRRDRLASFSNYGSGVDVAAPGVEIVSTEGVGVAYMSGTSMAAPHVAGIAALARSFKPGLAPSTVISSIRSGAQKSSALTGKVKTGGVADAAGTLNALGAGITSTGTGASPGEFKLRKPGKHVRIRGKRGTVRFSWSRASDTDLIGYDVVVNGKVRAQVRGTHARIKVPAGRLKWSVVAIDAEGNTTTATKSSSSNGRISVLSAKKRR